MLGTKTREGGVQQLLLLPIFTLVLFSFQRNPEVLEELGGHHHVGSCDVSDCAVRDISSVTVPLFADMEFWISLSAQIFHGQITPGDRNLCKWECDLQTFLHLKL